MKKLLIIISLLLPICSSVFAYDKIITTTGDVTAGVGRQHRRASAYLDTAGRSSLYLVVGIDSTSSTAHKLYGWETNDEGNTWGDQGRFFTAGFANTQLDPTLTMFRADTVWVTAPTTYSGSNMKVSRARTNSIVNTDTISPASTNMLSGIMRWTGDTLIYAYYDNIEGNVIVVKSGNVWSQSVTWTAIDSLVANFSDVDYDYCGSGVALWDRAGLDMYWFDGTVNDAWYTLGTNKLPTLLSSTAMNATTMAVYHDSLIVLIGYLARDTALWRYRYYATGGSRKSGMTLIDSSKILSKAYYSGNTSDSMSPMPCLSGSLTGDTATLAVRYWPNPSNQDSIVIGYNTTGIWGGQVGEFVGNDIIANTLTYGEGRRFRGLCSPRYISNNMMVFWQKGVSSPDSIYVSFGDAITLIGGEPLTQLMLGVGIDTFSFRDSNVAGGFPEVEDYYINGTNATFNYGSTGTFVTQNVGSGGSANNPAAFIRPNIVMKIPFPCRITNVTCSLTVQANPTTASSINIRALRVWKQSYEGNEDAAAPPGGANGDSGSTWNNSRLGLTWGAAGCKNNAAANAVYSALSTSTYQDSYTGGFLNASSPIMNTLGVAAETRVGSPWIGASNDHWHRWLKGEIYSIGWAKVIMQTSATTTLTFYSSEAATASKRPHFIVSATFAEGRNLSDQWFKNARSRLKSKATLYTPL